MLAASFLVTVFHQHKTVRGCVIANVSHRKNAERRVLNVAACWTEELCSFVFACCASRSVVKTATLKKVSPKRQLPFWYEKKDSSCLFGYENSTFWSKRRLSFLSFLHGSNKNRCRRVWHLFSIALIRTWYEFFSYGSDKNRLVRVLFLWLW